MKDKRYTTEEKIRMLREVGGGRSVREMCQEKNISEATYHRWRTQFGLMEVNEARGLKELERENGELKEMLVESLLKNRGLEAVCKKSSERGGAAGAGATTDRRRDVFCASGLPYFEAGPFDVSLSCEAGDATGAQPPATVEGVVRATPTLRLPSHHGVAAAGRLGGGQASGAALAQEPRAACAAHAKEGCAAWCVDRIAGAGAASGPCVDVGLHRGCDGARWSVEDADGPR